MTITTVPASGQYGYIPDSLPQELPVNAWSTATNVRFRNGYAERFRGNSQVFTTPSVTPYFIIPYRNQNSKFWIHAGIARVYSDDGTTRTDLTPATPYTGAIDDRWTGGSASGVLVINNGIDQPQFAPAALCRGIVRRQGVEEFGFDTALHGRLLAGRPLARKSR